MSPSTPDLSQGLRSTLKLNDGHRIPILGLGTAGMGSDEETEVAVTTALGLGYRHFDSASLYGSEIGLGRALHKSGIPRNEIFVTTKVWNTEQGYNQTLEAFARSQERLGLEMIDLYLIHWPKPEHTTETWRAMMDLRKANKIHSLGVSNFKEHHFAPLFAIDETPVVNQVELHPQFPQAPLLKFCQERGIIIQGWSPLVRGKIDTMKILTDIGAQYNKTAAQVALRWQIQQGIVTLPKSVSPERLAMNAKIFDFSLTDKDFEQIGTLTGERIWDDPDNPPA